MLVLTSRARESASFLHKGQGSKRDSKNLDSTHSPGQEVCRDLDHLRSLHTSKPCNTEPLEATPKLQHQPIEAKAMQVSQTNLEALYPLQKKYAIIATIQGI